MADPVTPDPEPPDRAALGSGEARRAEDAPRTAGWGWAVFGVSAFATLVLFAAGTNRDVQGAIGSAAAQGLRGAAGLVSVVGCGALAAAKGWSAAWGLTALACYLGVVLVPLLPPVARQSPPPR